MRASNFEFRFRFWVIAFIFYAAFAAYSLDPVNAAVALVRFGFGPGLNLDMPHGRHVLQAIFLGAALLVTLAALKVSRAATDSRTTPSR